jgi:polar amino acid transport system substrate-binding protein
MVENFHLLDQGIIDYFITVKYPGITYLLQNSTSHKIVPHEVPVVNDNIYFGFSKKSACAPLAEYVGKRLEEFDKKGVTEKLLKKYLKGAVK